jgi:succinate-acetate transporter protein
MKAKADNTGPRFDSGLGIFYLALTVLLSLWPLLIWVWGVYNGVNRTGNLRSAFGFSFTLVPLLCVLSLLIIAFALARQNCKVTSIAVGVLVGSLISYSCLYVFDRKVNWRESHVHINDTAVFGLIK